jgi:hypothetical protein
MTMITPSPIWYVGRTYPSPNPPAKVVFDCLRAMTDSQASELRQARQLLTHISATALLVPLLNAANELQAHVARLSDIRDMSIERSTQTSLLVDQLLNQVLLLKNRLVRNVRMFLGEAEAETVEAAFKAEFELSAALPPSPHRIMTEFRHSGQHRILPTSVLSIRSRSVDGTRRSECILDFDHWQAIDKKFPTELQQLLTGTREFNDLLGEAIAFYDNLMSQVLLANIDRIDKSAQMILDLITEVHRLVSDDHPSSPVVFGRYDYPDGSTQWDQIPLELVQVGEVALNSDYVRSQAGLPKRWNVVGGISVPFNSS